MCWFYYALKLSQFEILLEAIFLTSFLCVSRRTSTSSAIRLLWSTWEALTTMQRKWRDNHASIFLLLGPQTNRGERQQWHFSGRTIRRWIVHQQGQKATTKTATRNLCLTAPTLIRASPTPRSWCVWRLSMCNPYTYLSVPVWRTYNTCLLWSAISNMNQWNTNGFWTGIMILYVYKIQKIYIKKTKTQRAWIFAAP